MMGAISAEPKAPSLTSRVLVGVLVGVIVSMLVKES